MLAAIIPKMNVLEKLIKEGEELYKTINFVPSSPNVIRLYSVYKSNQSEKYQNWISAVNRFIKTNHPSDLEDLKPLTVKVNPDNHKKIMGILSAIQMFPDEPIIGKTSDSSTYININNTQSNKQEVVFNLFVEIIKDEISGKDYKVLKELLEKYKTNPESEKPRLLEKIKSFGGDVLSNIVANILTNPSIYG